MSHSSANKLFVGGGGENVRSRTRSQGIGDREEKLQVRDEDIILY